MTSATFYRADSVRVENGGTGRVFGKFAGRVESATVVAQQSSDGWSYIVPGRWTGGMFATEAEAIAAGEASLIASGWSTDLAAAEVESDRLAEARHESHCRKSASYKQVFAAK